MIQTETTTIGDLEWSCTQFSGTKSLDVLHTLFTVLGPGIAAMLQGKTSAGAEDLHALVAGVVARIDSADKLQSVVMKVLRNTRVNGKPMTPEVFDDVFAGTGIRSLVPAMVFVIRVNYGDFTQAAEVLADITGHSVADPLA